MLEVDNDDLVERLNQEIKKPFFINFKNRPQVDWLWYFIPILYLARLALFG